MSLTMNSLRKDNLYSFDKALKKPKVLGIIFESLILEESYRFISSILIHLPRYIDVFTEKTLRKPNSPLKIPPTETCCIEEKQGI